MTVPAASPFEPERSIGSTPTDRLLASLQAWRASEVLDGAGEPRADVVDGDGDHGRGREVERLRREIDQLHEVIAGRAVIEQAKGVLILRYGLGPEDAFALLVRWSQTSNVKVRTITEALVHAVCRGDDSRPYDPSLVRWLAEHLRAHGPAKASPGPPTPAGDQNGGR